MTANDKENMQTRTSSHQNLTLILSLVFVLIGVLGFVIHSTVIDYARDHERRHLTKLAEVMQLSLDPAAIDSLAGSKEDLSTSTYTSVKSMLESIRNIDQSYRFVYLMAKTDHQIIFLADAEPRNSPDFSPPGQKYPNPSDELHQIFVDGKAFVEGPITDSWGEWISAHAAIRHPVTGDVMAIIGADIDAGEWSTSINAYRFFVITIILLMVLIASVFSFALIRISRDRDFIGHVNQELRKTREELLQSERLAVLGQLNAVVSHEIRNPLGTISNALHMMDEAVMRVDKEVYGRSMELCVRNVDRCNRIISELLDFSKTNTLEKEKIFIDRWLGEILDQSPALTQINVEKALSSGAEIEIDKDRMQRAVDNVCLNAAQAMSLSSETQATIKVQTIQEDDQLKIRFTDYGPGISGEVMESIFKPMFSTKNFGVGLGLSIVQNIMTDHGGGIKIDSIPGKETIVTLWLPLH